MRFHLPGPLRFAFMFPYPCDLPYPYALAFRPQPSPISMLFTTIYTIIIRLYKDNIYITIKLNNNEYY